MALYTDAVVSAGTTTLGTVARPYTGPRPAAIQPTSGVAIFRPEQGLAVRLSHDAPVYNQVPWFANYQGIMTDIPGTLIADANNSLLATSTFNGRTGGGICAFDNDWTPVCVQFQSPNVDASYVVEICVCAEVVPQTASAFYALTKEGSPKTNQPALFEKVIKEVGPAIPLASSTPMMAR